MTTPNIQDLQAFCAVVDLGTLTAAAKMLDQTKGNVSRRLTRLERALGVALLRRDPHRVTPTDEGIEFRAALRPALASLDAAMDGLVGRAASPRSAVRGRVRIAAPVDVAVHLLPAIVARCLERYPGLRIDVMASDQVIDLEAHQVDLALRIAINRLPDSALIAQRLLTIKGGFFAAPAYLERRRLPRTIDDLQTHALLGLQSVTDAMLARLISSSPARTRPRTLLRPAVRGDGAVVRELALCGAGIALLPTFSVAPDVAQGRLVQLLPQHQITLRGALFAVTPASRAKVPAVLALRDLLVEGMRTAP